MSHEEIATASALQRLGIAVTQDIRTGLSWGWSMQNDKIIRPWVGPYATAADATAAALDWVLEQAWRGVLYPILHTETSADDRYLESGDDLLAPWVRAFERGVLALEVQPLDNSL